MFPNLSLFLRRGFTTVVGLGLLTCGIVFGPTLNRAAAQQSTPPPATIVDLGRKLFNDTTLSEPRGQACASCHAPESGFSHPVSRDNEDMGPVPGAVKGRFGFRKPPTVSYASLLPTGIPHFDVDADAYVGGLFYDGRAADTTEQAKAPFLNPNEMNNIVHFKGSKALVVFKVMFGPSSKLFRTVYGQNVFRKPVSVVYDLIAKAIAEYEGSPEVSPFTSKYDAFLEGRYFMTPLELRGLRLVTGTLEGRRGGIPFRKNAHCMDCHGISDDLSVSKDLWTNSCYANLGVPRNEFNPFYKMTNRHTNPLGYNPLGERFVDFGLGDFLYPLMGKPSGNLEENDPLHIDGTFKAPTLRNVDKRPYTGFVKSYMHNGAFKSLKEVVHFYNTRNQTTHPGEIIDFTNPNPYAGLRGIPLWPKPEYPSPDTMINPKGLFGGEDDLGGMGGAEIGNLGLTEEDENGIVAFLQTLSDGYFKR